MNVLLVHLSDNGRGGGNLAMRRLHRGLSKEGVESKILCLQKTLATSESCAIPRSKGIARLERLLRKATSQLGLNDIHCLSTFGVKHLEAYRQADVLDFHCIHGGFFNYLALPSLTAHKPAVFTLHDMWPFTGHCGFSEGCERWRTGCGRCPSLDSHPEIKRDGTRIEWKLKQWVYSRSNLAIVTLCTRRTEEVKQSLLGRFPIYQIPNGVDTEVFRPLDVEFCRKVVGLPLDKRVVMFSAAGLTNTRKGGDVLVRALQTLPQSLRRDLVLLTMGDGGEAVASTAGIEAVHLGYVSYEPLKAAAYAAADIFVLPARDETLPLVLLESMACGTPMVACDVGGIPDLVRPEVTGFLARRGDFTELAARIAQLLEDPALRRRMRSACRAIAVAEYPIELQVRRYLAVYRDVIDGAAAGGAGATEGSRLRVA